MSLSRNAHNAHTVTLKAYWGNGLRCEDEESSTACPCGEAAEHARSQPRVQAEYLGGPGHTWRVTGAAATRANAAEIARETAKALAHLHHPFLVELSQ